MVYFHGKTKKNEAFGGIRFFERAPSENLSREHFRSTTADFLNQPKTTNLKWTLKLRCKDKGFFNTVQVFY